MELQEQGFTLLVVRMQGSSAGEEDARDRVLRMGDAYLCFAYEQPELYQLIRGWNTTDVPKGKTLSGATQVSSIVQDCLEKWAAAQEKRSFCPIRQPPRGSPGLAELLKYMVSESDNTACDVLLRLVGGPKVVTQYLRGLGINDIVVANTEKELGQDTAVQYRNYATPDAAVVLLRAFHEGKGLSKSSQALLQRLMTETSTGLKRIKGLLPDGTVVAHKTGTSSTANGVTAATNDVGLVTLPNGRHLAIAVFVSDSKANDVIREEAIAKVAKAAWDEWSK